MPTNDNAPPQKTFSLVPTARQKPTSNATASRTRTISALVSRLLSHYWTAADPPEIRQAQLEDWIEDLAEFSPADVHNACRQWRIANSRRPTPGDIRALCSEGAPQPATNLNLDAYAQSVGWPSWEARQTALEEFRRKRQQSYELGSAWQQQNFDKDQNQ